MRYSWSCSLWVCLLQVSRHVTQLWTVFTFRSDHLPQNKTKRWWWWCAHTMKPMILQDYRHSSSGEVMTSLYYSCDVINQLITNCSDNQWIVLSHFSRFCDCNKTRHLMTSSNNRSINELMMKMMMSCSSTSYDSVLLCWRSGPEISVYVWISQNQCYQLDVLGDLGPESAAGYRRKQKLMKGCCLVFRMNTATLRESVSAERKDEIWINELHRWLTSS